MLVHFCEARSQDGVGVEEAQHQPELVMGVNFFCLVEVGVVCLKELLIGVSKVHLVSIVEGLGGKSLVLLTYILEGDVLKHDGEERAAEGVELRSLDGIVLALITGCIGYLWSSISGSADPVLDQLLHFLRVAEVDEHQPVIVRDHGVVWLDIAVCYLVNLVEVD